MNPARFKAAALPGPTNPGPRKEILFLGPRHPPRLSQGLLADNSWVSVAQHSPRQPADKAGGPVSPDLRPPPREPSCGSSQEEGEDAATPPSPPSARDGPAELRLPQRAMKMEKKTVAGLSKRWLARAVAQAELILQ